MGSCALTDLILPTLIPRFFSITNTNWVCHYVNIFLWFHQYHLSCFLLQERVEKHRFPDHLLGERVWGSVCPTEKYLTRELMQCLMAFENMPWLRINWRESGAITRERSHTTCKWEGALSTRNEIMTPIPGSRSDSATPSSWASWSAPYLTSGGGQMGHAL